MWALRLLTALYFILLVISAAKYVAKLRTETHADRDYHGPASGTALLLIITFALCSLYEDAGLYGRHIVFLLWTAAAVVCGVRWAYFMDRRDRLRRKRAVQTPVADNP